MAGGGDLHRPIWKRDHEPAESRAAVSARHQRPSGRAPELAGYLWRHLLRCADFNSCSGARLNGVPGGGGERRLCRAGFRASGGFKYTNSTANLARRLAAQALLLPENNLPPRPVSGTGYG